MKKPRSEIAIVGMGCRFPGGIVTHEQLWQALIQGKDLVTETPESRWNAELFYHPEPDAVGTSVSKWGGFLEDVKHFDPVAFGMSAREAKHIDPQQRLVLEASLEAIEDAGIPVGQLSGRKVGVYLGVTTWDYALQQFTPLSVDDFDAYSATGIAFSIVANRVSYCFNLKGPSMAVDTACSSSLIAVHSGCQSIWTGESEMVLVGGVNAMLHPGNAMAFSKMGILSKSGRCRAFSEGADGFVRGEGVGVALLMPLDKAQALGCPIYATVVASGSNQDGATNGLAVPNGEAQIDLLKSIYKDSQEIDVTQLGYFEAHGTGTEVGDAVEANSIGYVSQLRGADKPPLCIGSVKTNFGHLESASGILGLMKAALVCHHGVIPPNLHFDRPSPRIDFEKHNIRVVTESVPLPEAALVGINSFGFGGTNAHITLRAHKQTPNLPSEAPVLMPLSADTPAHLKRSMELLQPFIADTEHTLKDIASTLAFHREIRTFRRSLVVRTKHELQDQLQTVLDAAQNNERAVLQTEPLEHRADGSCFVFTGQGNQWLGMGQQLSKINPAFFATFLRCSDLFYEETGERLAEILDAPNAGNRLDTECGIAQPLIAAFQMALVDCWAACGVRPKAIIGHSAGEIAAAYASGILTLDHAMRMACRRGALIDRHAQRGRMLVVATDSKRLREILDKYAGRLVVSAYNSPRLLSVSGSSEDALLFETELRAAKIAFKTMVMPFAFHSQFMDACQAPLLEALDGMTFSAAKIPHYSSVTGNVVSTVDNDYWWRNIRDPVRFHQAVQSLAAEGMEVFVEISPTPTLIKQVRDSARTVKVNAKVVASTSANDEAGAFLEGAGKLWCMGYDVQLSSLIADSKVQVKLPHYPWIKKSLWKEALEIVSYRTGKRNSLLLGRPQPGTHRAWLSFIDRHKFDLLTEHTFRSKPLFPAAGFIEMLYTAAYEIVGEPNVALKDIEISSGLFLKDANAAVQMLTEYRKSTDTLEIFSRLVARPETWKKHCHARVTSYYGGDGQRMWALANKLMECDAYSFSATVIYETSLVGQLHYGPKLQLLGKVWTNGHEVAADVRMPEAEPLTPYMLHPGALDACLQPGQTNRRLLFGIDAQHYSYVPRRIGRLEVHAPFKAKTLFVYCQKKMTTLKYSIDDIYIFDEQGTLLISLHDYETYGIDIAGDRTDATLESYAYQLDWVPIG